MAYSSKTVDEGPELVDLLFAQLLALGKSSDEGGHGTLEGLLHHLLQPGFLGLLLGDQGGDNGIFVLQHPPLRQAADDGVGGRLAPAQMQLGQLHQLGGIDGFIVPQQQAEPVFTFKNLGHFHLGFLLLVRRLPHRREFNLLNLIWIV